MMTSMKKMKEWPCCVNTSSVNHAGKSKLNNISFSSYLVHSVLFASEHLLIQIQNVDHCSQISMYYNVTELRLCVMKTTFCGSRMF